MATSNTVSTAGFVQLKDKDKGIEGVVLVRTLVLEPTTSAGTYTIKDFAGNLIYEGVNTTATPIVVPVNRSFRGIWLDDTIPTGGCVNVLLG